MSWNDPPCGRCGQPIASPHDAVLMAAAFSTAYWHLNCWEHAPPFERPLKFWRRLLPAARPKPAASAQAPSPAGIHLSGPSPSSAKPVSNDRRSRLQDQVIADCSSLVIAGAALETVFILALLYALSHPMPLLAWLVFLPLELVPIWMLALPAVFWVRLGQLDAAIAQYDLQKAAGTDYAAQMP